MAAVPTFTEDLYRRREAKIRAMMAGQGLDAVIVYCVGPWGPNFANAIEYLIGKCLTTSAVLMLREEDVIEGYCLPKALVPSANAAARVPFAAGGDDFGEVLVARLKHHGLERGRIGLVEVDSLRYRGIPHLVYQRLRDELPAAEFPTVTEEWEMLRLRAEPEEIAALEQAALDLDRVMDYWVDQVRPGARADEIAAGTKRWAATEGLALNALSCRAAPMDGSVGIHGEEARTRVLQGGDYVFFESSAAYGPFKAYRGFPIALGDPPPLARNLFETTLELAERVKDLLVPGKTTADISAMGTALLAERGLSTMGPIVFSPASGGWQMVVQDGFDGYRAPKQISYEPGMWWQDDPHVCTPDWSHICIVGNTVVVEEAGSRVVGNQGFRIVIK